MAERMIAADLRPHLWARRREVMDQYSESDAVLTASAATLAAACDVIGLCLYDAAATDAVLSGDDGLFCGLRPGTVVAVHSTVGPDYVQALAERLAERRVRLVDAPVSGGPAAAEGKLLVMVGGDDDDVAACQPMFATYSDNVVRLGTNGTAQATKLLNNALMAAITGLVFDLFELGGALGIDREGLARVLSGGSAANAVIDYYLGAGGAEQMSIKGWPTLHKDVELVRSLASSTTLADGQLVTTAAATIRAMERHREPWAQTRPQDDDRT